ncbi:hypothetical protein [Nonomuraea deserti]|uniref:hypothetical protein n=1 Tax=Nonomuraea deserti TaxID=1848322 RepID=UPI00140495D8|nr:hypothetical protein [Nonomuraea deserti]
MTRNQYMCWDSAATSLAPLHPGKACIGACAAPARKSIEPVRSASAASVTG